jgi:hypothetical protein
MPNSFRAALAGYGSTPNSDGTLPHLTKADREHLKRWADDDRTDEVWDSITCATRQHRLTLSDLPDGFFKWFFIQEVLGQRSLAESIGNRWKYRDLFRSRAAQMQEAANILREKNPDDFVLIPSGEKLAQMLEDAAKQYRDQVAVSWKSPGVVKWTRQSRPTDIFASSLSNILRDLAGKWLDHEVAVLTQIAFDDPDFDNDQVIWIRRGVERGKGSPKAAD